MYKSMCMTDDYKRALEKATREFEALSQQRADIDRRLTQLAHTMATLTKLCGYTPTMMMGLTDGCRMVLRAAGRPMTPAEVRDALGACGFDMSKYTNDLAAIHTVLKRLNEAGETRFATNQAGKGAYVYAMPSSVIQYRIAAPPSPLAWETHAHASPPASRGRKRKKP